MKARPQDIPALKRLIISIFSVENDHREELDAIVKDETLTMEEKGERYLDKIIEHLEFVPDITEEKKCNDTAK